MNFLFFWIITLAWAADDKGCPMSFGVLAMLDQEEVRYEAIKKNVIKEIDGSYYAVQKRPKNTPEKAAEWNQKLLQGLNALPVVSRGNRKAALTGDEIFDLYLKSNLHPTASILKVKKYDPTGNIGFCFGRAMHIHLEALKMGVSKDNIRKIWAVGEMKTDTILWQYHVATMVRGVDNRWWVIDPEYTKPLSLEDWYKDTNAMSTDGKLQFFSSSPSRWGPASAAAYNKDVMGGEIYNGFFKEILEQSRKEAAEIAKQRRKQRMAEEVEEAVKKIKR